MNHRSRSLRRSCGVALVAAVVLVAGCGSDDDATPAAPAPEPPATTEAPRTTVEETADAAELPAAHDAWVRMPATGQTVAAGYVTFVNGSDTDVQLVAVRSDLAEAELHETVADDAGVMRMQHRPDGFVVPANGELVMAPGGAHVMLLGVDPLDMVTLDEVELVFEFADIGELSVSAELRRDTAMPGHGSTGRADTDHDDTDHGDDAPGELDADALHALDDELHTGVYEPERQRELVARSLVALDTLDANDEVPDGVDADRLREALEELDVALADGDLDAAKALAFEVHDLTHSLVPHQH